MPGGRPDPTCLSGLDTVPVPSGICLPSSPRPCPKATYLLPGNRVAHGTWGAQVARARRYWELSLSCREQGELPTWQAETRTSQRP